MILSLKIPRTVVNEILTKAMSVSTADILWGIYDSEQKCCLFFNCEPKFNTDDLLNYSIIYNQSSIIINAVEKLQAQMQDQQNMIEIFEETKGVVGLRAYQKQGKMLKPLALEIMA